MSSLPGRLFRSGEELHIKSFLEEGEIRFRPLSFYRSLEDETRRDEFEGAITLVIDSAKIEIQDEQSGNWVHPIDVMSGRMTQSLKELDELHVCCFSKASSTMAQSKFGISTVEVFDVPNFLLRLEHGLQQIEAELYYGSVKYYDDRLPIDFPGSGALWLYKRVSFAGESEFRVCLRANRSKLYARLRGEKLANAEVPSWLTFRFGSFLDCARLL
jgi:hypothetical protein